MQSDRYGNDGITIGNCTWCDSEYSVGCSRAQEQAVFCSKKCEIEARFWLIDTLKEVEHELGKPHGDPGEILPPF